MNKDGSNQHAVAANPNADGYPAWNGAGTKLAFGGLHLTGVGWDGGAPP